MTSFGGIAKEFGLRLGPSGLLPSTLLGVFLFALVGSGAPFSKPDLTTLITKTMDLKAQDIFYISMILVISGIAIEPLMLRITRWLAGEWAEWGPAAWFAELAIRVFKARQKRLVARAQASIRVVQQGATYWRLMQRFPSSGHLLPTELGNVLRAAEQLVYDRYGIDAEIFFPRLGPLLPDKLLKILDNQRDGVEAAARFSAVSFLAAIASAALLLSSGWWIVIPVVAVCISWWCYRVAIDAAIIYGDTIESAFDLYRFDVLRALHIPLPHDTRSEKQLFEDLNAFLSHAPAENLMYKHPPG